MELYTFTILEIIHADRRNVLPTILTVQGTKIERLGVWRERAEFLTPFVGQAMSKAQFNDLVMERSRAILRSEEATSRGAGVLGGRAQVRPQIGTNTLRFYMTYIV